MPKPPEEYAEKIVDFLAYVRSIRTLHNISDNDIIACDETAIWYDAASKSTVEKKGAKEVTVRSTGHTKNRITVLLSAKGDGTKLKPYILLPRKRPMPGLVRRFGSRAVLKFEGTNWLNQCLTEDYLKFVIGASLFPKERLLVWDKCHMSDATKLCLRKSKLLSTVIPGGCSGFIQAPDLCWNKPFKDHYTKAYDDWFESGNQEFTAGGNPKSAPLETIVEWIMSAWAKINREEIINSFKVCA